MRLTDDGLMRASSSCQHRFTFFASIHCFSRPKNRWDRDLSALIELASAKVLSIGRWVGPESIRRVVARLSLFFRLVQVVTSSSPCHLDQTNKSIAAGQWSSLQLAKATAAGIRPISFLDDPPQKRLPFFFGECQTGGSIKDRGRDGSRDKKRVSF
jgi:hypothetical protein